MLTAYFNLSLKEFEKEKSFAKNRSFISFKINTDKHSEVYIGEKTGNKRGLTGIPDGCRTWMR